jgi:uncharacterized protein YecE (DUF72 family)
MKAVWIGTSGWSYAGWRGSFYPQDVPQKNWLRHYATIFATTEINASFYRTPTLNAVKDWREQTPKDFLFAWKASKFITHWKRLGPTCDNSIALMQTRLACLRPKVGMVLFQLPANFGKNTERLEAFLRMLPRGRYTFEFRDDSWYSDDVYALLHERNVALCISDHRDAPAPWEVTASHVYVRGHGPTGAYRDNYPGKTLKRWADQIRQWRRQRREVFVYFDNDQKGAAPQDALRLLNFLRD